MPTRKNPKLLWLVLRVSGLELPVYCTSTGKDYGYFDGRLFEICIDSTLSAAAACITLGHEWYHARLYANDHLNYAGDVNEGLCDRFSHEAFEFMGGPPSHWRAKWEKVREEWARAKKAVNAG